VYLVQGHVDGRPADIIGWYLKNLHGLEFVGLWLVLVDG